VSDKEIAPAVLEHPGARTIGGDPMIKGSVPYVLCRIEDDASLTPISQHGDFLTGIAAGGYAVEVEDLEAVMNLGENRIEMRIP
jgi:hypothetical protein